MFENINAVFFFESLWGFIPYLGTNERECVLSRVSFFETDKSISDFKSTDKSNQFLVLKLFGQANSKTSFR